MRYRTLGRSGIKVSAYALGAMMFGSVGNPDHDESARIIHKALDAGVNVIDTAPVYSNGESEEIVGKALKGRRGTVVLATKAPPRTLVSGPDPTAGDPNRGGNSRRAIITAAEDSLRRLQTDWIDLYQIHRPDPDAGIEETLSALSDLIHAGKVRAIGTSAMPASDIVEAQWAAERRSLLPFRSEQPAYSILNRGIEAEVLPVAQRHGIGIIVWSPLAQGLLTGRARKGHQTDLRRTAIFSHMRDERRLDAVEKIIPLADEAGLPMTHLAMAFAITHPAVTSALIGPRTMEQLDDLLAGLDVTLTDDTLDQIDQIVPPGTDVGTLDMAYRPPALQHPDLRRHPPGDRSAALPASAEHLKRVSGHTPLCSLSLIAAGFCERAAPGQGARSARGAAPEVPLTRSSGSRIIAAGRGRGAWRARNSVARSCVAASLGRGGARSGGGRVAGAGQPALPRPAGRLARVPVT